MQPDSAFNLRARLCCLGYPGYPGEQEDRRRAAASDDLDRGIGSAGLEPDAEAPRDALLHCVAAIRSKAAEEDVA